MKKIIYIITLNAIHCLSFSQQNVTIKGVITDANNTTIPYASIGILSKNIGTVSNEEGAFIFELTESNLNDTLSVSTIGFTSFKIRIQDFLELNEKVIVLEEEPVLLDEIVLTLPITIVKEALKKLKETTYRKPHQLNVLYRRFSNENNISRFLVEQYIKVLDTGPTSSTFNAIEIAQSRKSNDYRYVKKKQKFHAVEMIAKQNPLRKGISLKKFNWETIDYTSYDGEDVIIVEGKEKGKPQKWIRLYIGYKTRSIYKLEKSDLKAVYIYKKNKEGKLVLSYHNREYVFWETISPYMQKLLKLEKDEIKLSYRHEAVVLGIEYKSKSIRVNDNLSVGKDIGDYNIAYQQNFWNNINLPPDSKFYKTSSKQLELLYGIPLENQFKTPK